MLTIYYDSHCPLCNKEMQHLKNYDDYNRIHLEDLHQQGFEAKFPHIDHDSAMNFLHGESAGEVLTGLDVTHKAWSLVGKAHWVSFLKWPVVNCFAKKGYQIFAKHRHTISRVLTGNKSCDVCKKPN